MGEEGERGREWVDVRMIRSGQEKRIEELTRDRGLGARQGRYGKRTEGRGSEEGAKGIVDDVLSRYNLFFSFHQRFILSR
jgi:hypothetical protein